MGAPQRGRAHRAARQQASQARAGHRSSRSIRLDSLKSEFRPPAARSTTPFPPTNGQRRPLVELARWWSRRSGGRQPLAGLRTPSRAFDRTHDAPSTGPNTRAGNNGSGWRRPERRSLDRRNPLAKRRGSSVRLWRKVWPARTGRRGKRGGRRALRVGTGAPQGRRAGDGASAHRRRLGDLRHGVRRGRRCA